MWLLFPASFVERMGLKLPIQTPQSMAKVVVLNQAMNLPPPCVTPVIPGLTPEKNPEKSKKDFGTKPI
jgi:hypothetical protein